MKNEAERNKVSLNTLVNQVLQQHLDWHAHAVKAGQVPIAKGLITSLINRLSEEEVIKLAKDSMRYPKEIVLLTKTEYSIPKVLEVFESWIRAAGFPLVSETQGNQHFFVIQHDMGMKWSLFLSELSKSVYGSLGTKIETAITDNTFFVKVIIP